jgi:TATA-binding protein-associated factor Taf7
VCAGQIIETVEKEVERLLKDDQRAERVEYGASCPAASPLLQG